MRAFLNYIFIVVLCLGSVQAFAAEKSDKPYKARTADECIHEKECVWYVLDKYTLRPNQTEGDDEKLILWTRDVRVITIDDKAVATSLRSEVAEFLKPINAITPMDVRVDKTANIFLIVTDDIVGSYRSHYFSLFDKVLSAYDMRRKGMSINAIAEVDMPCVSINNIGIATQSYSNVIVFIRTRNLSQNCWKLALYGGLGAQNVVDVFPQKGTDLNALQLFIIEILYHQKVKSGMTIGAFKNAFDDVYADVLKERK